MYYIIKRIILYIFLIFIIQFFYKSKLSIEDISFQDAFQKYYNNYIEYDIPYTNNIEIFTLNNGLKVILIPNHRSPTIIQSIWYRVGSYNDPQGLTGIAHLLEHLMFKGTKKYPFGEFDKFIAKIGGEENAFTFYNYTAYYQKTSPEYLKDIMIREADRMSNIIFNEYDIDDEKKIVKEERRMRIDNDPFAILSEEMNATLFFNTPYRTPVIGWNDDIENINLKSVTNFYKNFYKPNNAVLIIEGDIITKEVKQFTKNIYGNIKKRDNIFNIQYTKEPISKTFRKVLMHDPRITTSNYEQIWIVPSYTNKKNREAEALYVLAEILSGSKNSRLYKNLVLNKNIAMNIIAEYKGLLVNDGLFYINGVTNKNTNIEELRYFINDEIDNIIKYGVSIDELIRAKRRLFHYMHFIKDDPLELISFYGTYISIGLNLEDLNQSLKKIKNITTLDIQNVAKKYLLPNKGVIGNLLPANIADKYE